MRKKDKPAIMKLPRMKTKKVYIGCYFNHYNAIVLFRKKPMFYMESNHEGEVIDLLAESNKANNVIGCTTLEEITSLFPTLDLSELIDETTGNVLTLDPQKLITAKITAPWDEHDKLLNINWDLDGYQY